MPGQTELHCSAWLLDFLLVLILTLHIIHLQHSIIWTSLGTVNLVVDGRWCMHGVALITIWLYNCFLLVLPILTFHLYLLLKNIGGHFETWNTGVLGPVVLHGLDQGKWDLSWAKWTYQVLTFPFSFLKYNNVINKSQIQGNFCLTSTCFTGRAEGRNHECCFSKWYFISWLDSGLIDCTKTAAFNMA